MFWVIMTIASHGSSTPEFQDTKERYGKQIPPLTKGRCAKYLNEIFGCTNVYVTGAWR
jgi:hypothetical protein